jgi:hypothetical protein
MLYESQAVSSVSATPNPERELKHITPHPALLSRGEEVLPSLLTLICNLIFDIEGIFLDLAGNVK